MMPFIRPAVHVWQIIVNLTPSVNTPFTELCIVGPVYQVVRNAACATYQAGGTYTTPYIGRDAGTVVDQASVQCEFQNVDIKLWPTTVATLSDTATVDNTGATTLLKVTSDKKFEGSGVAVGDIAVVTLSAVTYTSTVHSVDADGLTVTLRKNIPTTGSTGSGAVTIIRRVPPDAVTKAPYTHVVPTGSGGMTASATEVSLDASITCLVGGSTYRVFKAAVALTYRALRTAIANDFIQITSLSVGQAKAGTVDALNPMSVAIDVVYKNVNIPFKILPIESDDSTGYSKAIGVMTTTDKVFVIIPLSQDKIVVENVALHCQQMSLPEKSRWRITYANLPLPVTKVVVEINDGVIKPGTVAGAGAWQATHAYLLNDYTTISGKVLRCTTAGTSADEAPTPPATVNSTVTDGTVVWTWILPTTVNLYDDANGVFVSRMARVNDFVDFYNAENTYQYSLKISDVLNDTVCVLGTTFWVKTDEGYTQDITAPTTVEITSDTALQYEVVRVLDNQGVADEMGIIAQSFANKNLRLVFPDQCMVTIGDVKHTMPGYYVAVAYGAIRAGFPPHQGFTTLGIGGIDRILGSNGRFDDNQLDQMAGAGVFIVVQDEPESLPYCIYQTTTDITALETREDSVVTTIHYASKFYKDNLRAAIGKMNVNEISAKFVAGVLKSCTEKMQGMVYPYIGPLLVSGRTKTIELNGDKIKAVQAIKVPFPVNEIDLYLEV